MSKNDRKEMVSQGLEQVWAWKEAIYREVAHLPTEQALEEILRKAHSAAERLNLLRRDPIRPTALRRN